MRQRYAVFKVHSVYHHLYYPSFWGIWQGCPRAALWCCPRKRTTVFVSLDQGPLDCGFPQMSRIFRSRQWQKPFLSLSLTWMTSFTSGCVYRLASRSLVGKRGKAAQKSAALRPCPTSGHRDQKPQGAVFHFNPQREEAARAGLIWPVARQKDPSWAAFPDCYMCTPYLPRIPGAGSISDRRWPRLHSPAIPFRP